MEGSQKRVYRYILALLFKKKKRDSGTGTTIIGTGTTLIGTGTTHAKRGSGHLVPIPHYLVPVLQGEFGPN